MKNIITLGTCSFIGHGTSTTKWPFRSSSQAVTFYYQSNHSKVEASC